MPNTAPSAKMKTDRLQFDGAVADLFRFKLKDGTDLYQHVDNILRFYQVVFEF